MWARNKYHNKKVTVNGEKFDSISESKRWRELQLLQRAGRIKNLQRQVKFKLLDKVNWNGETLRSRHFIVDFVYDDEDDQHIAEDRKGFATPEYKLKRHMFLQQYPEYKFIET